MLRLNAAYDAVKDTNTGEVSGDCTEPGTLPFSDKGPAHNIKIEVDGKHRGNIYMVNTTSYKDSKSVWHLDAVQFPNAAIDWDNFVQEFVRKIGREAEEQDIDFITINKKPPYISNYDYISAAFLKYLGVVHTESIHYEQLEASEVEGLDYGAARELMVNFPPETGGRVQFQGDGRGQLVLWEHPRHREK